MIHIVYTSEAVPESSFSVELLDKDFIEFKNTICAAYQALLASPTTCTYIKFDLDKQMVDDNVIFFKD